MNPAPTPRAALDELKEHLAALDLYSGLLPELVAEAQAALAAKDAEIEAFKANNRYMRGHTAGYEEAERKWKARAEKAEASLATSIAFVARLQERQRELMKEAGELWHERDALRAEVERLKLQNASLIEQRDRLVQTRTPDDEVEELRAALAAAQQDKERLLEVVREEIDRDIQFIIERCRAAIDAAKVDKERLIKASAALLNELDGEAFEIVGTARAEVLYEQAASVRAAIDAARKAQP